MVKNKFFNMSILIETSEGKEWSRIYDNVFNHDGVIVDVGCLNWGLDWGNILIGKKRYIGVDPIEKNIPNGCELFEGVLGAVSGNAKLIVSEITVASSLISNKNINTFPRIDVKMLCWKEFCNIYNIKNISVLKINIEGAEYPLLNSMDSEDFDKIDQIAISFHERLNPNWSNLTKASLNLLEMYGFELTPICNLFSWYIAKKK